MDYVDVDDDDDAGGGRRRRRSRRVRKEEDGEEWGAVLVLQVILRIMNHSCSYPKVFPTTVGLVFEGVGLKKNES